MAVTRLVAGHHSPGGASWGGGVGVEGGRLHLLPKEERSTIFLPGHQGQGMLLRMAERLEPDFLQLLLK